MMMMINTRERAQRDVTCNTIPNIYTQQSLANRGSYVPEKH
jgi:hypothetical protein